MAQVIDELAVELSEGSLLEIDADGQGAWLEGSRGGLWRYQELLAWDAEGAAVPAWLEAREGGLVVRLDAAGARWPLTVDPDVEPAGLEEDKLTASDGAAGDYFGHSVAGAGDLDGDGYEDLVIGAPRDDGSSSGSAYVYAGACRDLDEDGFCPVEGDCDDGDSSIHPSATELVDDEVDQDCDGFESCFADADDDGYTDGVSTVASADTDCTDGGEGTASDPTGDCDDSDPAVSPEGTELVDDGMDQDCDGTELCFVDADADGYTDGTSTVASDDTDCADSGEGTAADPTGECDDADAAVNPDADELCDGIDNDCDGTVDNDDALDAPTWYADADGDGAGDPDTAFTACAQPEGSSQDASDCDDSDPERFPGATEIEDDGVDQDCDGQDLETGCGGCASGSSPTGAGLLAGLLALLGLRRRGGSLRVEQYS